MRLYGVRIFVGDLAAARGFYIGKLGLSPAWDMPDIGAFGVALENAQLIIETPGDEDAELIGRFVGLSLMVGDIDAEYARLGDEGVTFRSPPQRQPWGGTLAHFEDPAGNVLTLLGGLAD